LASTLFLQTHHRTTTIPKPLNSVSYPREKKEKKKKSSITSRPQHGVAETFFFADFQRHLVATFFTASFQVHLNPKTFSTTSFH
jgi:hypothetical protein